MDCGYIDTTGARNTKTSSTSFVSQSCDVIQCFADSNPDAKWSTDYCFDKQAYVCTIPKFVTQNMNSHNQAPAAPTNDGDAYAYNDMELQNSD